METEQQPDSTAVRLQASHYLVGGLLGRLQALGVEVRFDRTTMNMLWRPTPAAWDAETRDMVRVPENRMALVKLLVPHGKTRWFPRAGWTSDGLQTCRCCGGGTAQVDPLGVPRHPWCGWLGQHP